MMVGLHTSRYHIVHGVGRNYKSLIDFKELLITYYEDENDLSIGIYNIEENVFIKKSSLNY